MLVLGGLLGRGNFWDLDGIRDGELVAWYDAARVGDDADVLGLLALALVELLLDHGPELGDLLLPLHPHLLIGHELIHDRGAQGLAWVDVNKKKLGQHYFRISFD
jgi:hypothetical protein